MKKLFKFLLPLTLSLSLIFGGCALVRPANQNTKNQDKIAKVVQKTETTKSEINKSDQDKLDQTASYAFGVNYSLNQVTNITPPVSTAIELNGRIISIVGSPALDEMNKIKLIVDLMNSEIEKENEKGRKLLKNKDEEVIELQNANKELRTTYENQINELIAKSRDVARNGDNAQATLSEMSGNFGLNAVWWGIKRFVFSTLTTILIFGIIFLILRIASASNPIAAAIFNIFNMIGSTFLYLIRGLTPKAIDWANLVHSDVHNKYKQTLDKIVDTIERFKITCEASNKQCTLADVLDELDRNMDETDKQCIKDILKDQKWN